MLLAKIIYKTLEYENITDQIIYIQKFSVF